MLSKWSCNPAYSTQYYEIRLNSKYSKYIFIFVFANKENPLFVFCCLLTMENRRHVKAIFAQCQLVSNVYREKNVR